MFAVDEASVEAIRQAFEERGELTAAVELRRRFPGIGDVGRARQLGRVILARKPISDRPAVNPR